MSEYRHKETGLVQSQGAWRKHYANVSLPRTWTAATLQALKLEAVLEAPKPNVGQYEIATRDGVTKDAKGNWVTAWAVRPMFSDYTDDDGVAHTKAEQETAYQVGIDATAAEGIRAQRDNLISETDYLALSDNTLTPEMAAYRQALRDITDHVKFPYLDEADWPVKPI